MSDETQKPNPEPTPTPTENQNSEVNSIPINPKEPTTDVPIPANEPLNSTGEAETSKPNITIEKHGTDTTITEVMQPTAQMAGDEPLARKIYLFTAELDHIKLLEDRLVKRDYPAGFALI